MITNRMQPSDVIVSRCDPGYGSGRRLHLYVLHPGALGKVWPSLAYYNSQWFEWDTNEPSPNGVYGHGVYKSIDPMIFIDADGNQVLDLGESEHYKD